MQIPFYKYQGTGNDFVMIDNRELHFPKDNHQLIAKLCDRKFGVGADGLICIDPSDNLDFNMIYFNADGKEGSMCGNGGRCTVAFAKFLGIIKDHTSFMAVDGIHLANIEGSIVSLKMGDVNQIDQFDKHLFLNTGSPHHVTFVNNLSNYDVFTSGKAIRNAAPYNEEGTNVNFVEQLDANSFMVRTYERGVENETLSCGTGVTAVAIAAHKSGLTKTNTVKLNTPGGKLEVSFKLDNDNYREIFLKGEATQVFEGLIQI